MRRRPHAAGCVRRRSCSSQPLARAGHDASNGVIDKFGGSVDTNLAGLKGFIGTLDEDLLDDIEADPEFDVVSVEVADAEVKATAAPWGLDRIDQRDLPLDHALFTSPYSGSGVSVYVIDSGILPTHQEFGGRAAGAKDFVGDGRAGDCGATGTGHGTHVAGTIGGSTSGVARQARLVSLRVLDCSGNGTWSNVLRALDEVAKRASLPEHAGRREHGSLRYPDSSCRRRRSTSSATSRSPSSPPPGTTTTTRARSHPPPHLVR